jgi:glycine/D-amino acid oxidase-like deaminating enzyme
VRPEGVQPDPSLSPKAGIAPDISVTDYGHKIVYARLGQQLRIAAMVDIGYDGDELRESRIQALKNRRPQLSRTRGLDKAEAWTGMRPQRQPARRCWVAPATPTCG